MLSRRALLSRLAVLAATGGAVWLVRDRLPWLGPKITFAGDQPTPWLPVVGEGVLLEVEVRVNGREVRAVIDSGAQFSAIDSALAQHLQLPRTTALPFLAYGVSGAPSVTHTVALDLALPGLAAPGLRAATLDIQELSGITGRDFALLIGRDLLSRAVMEVDMSQRRLRLLPPETYTPPRDALMIPLQMRQGAPMAEVRIEDGQPIQVLIDTGANSVLALSSDAAQRAGLLAAERELGAARSVGLGGVALNRRVRVKRLRIGSLSLQGVPVLVYEAAHHAPAPEGLLGSGFLRRYRYALDLPGRRLSLTPPTPMIVPRLPERSRQVRRSPGS